MAFARVWPFPTLSRSPIEEQNDTTHDRAKIIGIEPGAGWMRKTMQAVEQYRLDLQLAEGSTAGMTAVDRQLPIVVTLWTPTWMAARYAMKLPHDPKGVFAASGRQPDRAKMFLREKPETGEIRAGIFRACGLSRTGGKASASSTIASALR